jgi:hypothetical protein
MASFAPSQGHTRTMPEPCPRIGSEDQARAALRAHDHARACLPAAREGDAGGWKWHRGGSRIAWHDPSSAVIYKIETAYYGSNATEHQNAQLLREIGKSWAPDTTLYTLGDSPATIVLAMQYYPVPVRSRAEIPGDALELALDMTLDNFRRTAELPEGQVKVVDLGDIMPVLLGMAARAGHRKTG